MKIYVVRHGETEANKKGLLQGWCDTDLSELGVDLAVKTGIGLKDVKFDVVYSSPLKRAHDTAKIILSKNNNPNVEIKIDDRIKEISMGDWEGKCIKGPKSVLPKEKVQEFFNNPFCLERFPNGESAKIVCERTQNFLHELVTTKNYDNVLIATHGFALRAMLNCIYDDPKDFWQGHVPYNCAVNIIEYKDGKFNFIAKDKIYYDKDEIVDRYKI